MLGLGVAGVVYWRAPWGIFGGAVNPLAMGRTTVKRLAQQLCPLGPDQECPFNPWPAGGPPAA
eukprot:1557278-Karenia_brevis.AAC.1